MLIILFIGCQKFYVVRKYDRGNIKLSPELSLSDIEIESQIKPFRDSLKASMNEVLNYSEVEMTTGIPEGNLGNFVADLVMKIGEGYYENLGGDKEKIDFALLNNGGLRTSLPKGEITRGKLYELMPFENELVVLTLSPNKVKELFGFIALKSDTNLSVKKGVPLSEQIKLIIESQKVKEVYVNKEKITGRNYKIITSDYLANGGDKMNFFLDPIKTEKLGVKLRDAIIEYVIKENDKGDRLNAIKDQRISYAK